ncbi:hypothetical protein PAESOLCIP111_00260 [Paenibacillus solanacearum]|uniref:Phosphoesterase n=1 Tax=Paenibacillus solanacearum TaxID=2048548 RepID=A0A916NLE0_9BACL|nr:metallophosphoesterase family protein [Paenibacillus solanacearum]CAG7598816.1 hypothetical protein PAESOLCIP111_00260 [Paenibacillus solanacearum]
MKLAFISDIHGNAAALDAVLEDIGGKAVDRIYVLGDLCYRGPEPKRALDRVRSLRTEVIKGNADEWVVRGVRPGEVPEQAIGMMNRERDWTLARLDADDVAYLNGLPQSLRLQFEGVSISAFHATPDSLFEIVPPFAADEQIQAKLMTAEAADIYIYGHIHKPYIRYLDGKVVINTGSVGLPFDGMTKASYAIVEVEQGSIRTSLERVAFPAEGVIRQYEEAQYPNAEMMASVIRNASVKL